MEGETSAIRASPGHMAWHAVKSKALNKTASLEDLFFFPLAVLLKDKRTTHFDILPHLWFTDPAVSMESHGVQKAPLDAHGIFIFTSLSRHYSCLFFFFS